MTDYRDSATVHHDEYKDSVPPPGIRREIRGAVQPEGDRISYIYGGETLHTGNIAQYDSGQQQLFHDLNDNPKNKEDNTPEQESGGGVLPSYPREYNTIRPEEDSEFKESAQRIGGAPGEARDIEGKPITPEDARVIQHLETRAMHPTDKGSFAARAQSAAAANVKEGVVEKDAGLSATLK